MCSPLGPRERKNLMLLSENLRSVLGYYDQPFFPLVASLHPPILMTCISFSPLPSRLLSFPLLLPLPFILPPSLTPSLPSFSPSLSSSLLFPPLPPSQRELAPGLGVADYMLEPVQRIPHYRLLLTGQDQECVHFVLN